MAERPDPVADLDWDPARARELGQDVVELWAELLAGLPELDVGGDFSAQAVRDRLDLDIPEEGASNDELIRRLRELVFDGSIYRVIPASSPTSRARARCRARQPT